VPDVWFAVPGDLATLTGGYAYARRLMAALPAAGWFAHHVPLPAGFPNPGADELQTTADIFASLKPGTNVLVDGLAFGALPPTLLSDRDLSFTALVHHPLADETGISAPDAARLKAGERAALALAQSVVVTSAHTGKTLADQYGVPRDWIYLAEPGTDAAPRAVGSRTAPKLLTVATLTHRKAHDVLIEGLARIKDLAWTIDLVGSAERDPAVTAKVRALITQHGLEDRVVLRGELQNAGLDATYAGADIFVLPSRHEGYGMVFAEALARGLPVVACAAGAVTDTVPDGTGLLVPPDDPDALSNALRRLLSSEALRRSMSERAWDHGRSLPTWSDTAAHVAEALWAAAP